jgi:hypothetical protein
MKSLRPGNRTHAIVPLAFMLLAMSAGCTGLGPRGMVHDRFDYASAISDSWKSQMLMNLVKIRYADAPVFVEVTSIISQYSVAGQLGAQADMTSTPWSHTEMFNGAVTWADRPTITYAPLTGEKFAKSFLSPIPPASIMSMVQSGWPVDFVLRLTCDSVNGVRNRSSGQMNQRAADPRFEELLAALTRIQRSDTVGVRVQRKNNRDTAMVFLGREAKPETIQDMALVRQLLKLSPDAREFELVFGPVPKDDKELALLSRSMLQVLVELAACIDVPEEHLRKGMVNPTPAGARLIHVCSGPSAPASAFVAVPYRGSWFWIDDGDFESKRMLSLMMIFFSLTEPGGGGNAPVVTIPVG